jgi:hypothetical protein
LAAQTRSTKSSAGELDGRPAGAAVDATKVEEERKWRRVPGGSRNARVRKKMVAARFYREERLHGSRPIALLCDVAPLGCLPYRLKKHCVDELLMGCFGGKISQGGLLWWRNY